MEIRQEARKVKLSAPGLAGSSLELRNQALEAVAKALQDKKDQIFEANRQDMEQAERDGIDAPVLKRLKFDEGKLRDVVAGIQDLIAMPDPLFQIKLRRELDEGLELVRETCPIGVIGVIFEARPDALVQISALCIKSGNCVILKGGSEAKLSNRTLFQIIHQAVTSVGLPENCMLQLEARAEISDLLNCHESVDLLIPRGSN
ncbi:MAG: aldehyde dehydrogenase family protein, partial [Eubacterium sp.]|nr:aldehyde dehydrogenase family protein [Eubacterium sp.]